MSSTAGGTAVPTPTPPPTGYGIPRDRPGGQLPSRAAAGHAGNGPAPSPGLPATPLVASSPETGPAPLALAGHASAAGQALAGARGLGELLQRWESGSQAAPALPGRPDDAPAGAAPAHAAASTWDFPERKVPADLGTAWRPDAADTGPAAGPLPGSWPDRLLDDAVEMALELLLDREAQRHGLPGGAP